MVWNLTRLLVAGAAAASVMTATGAANAQEKVTFAAAVFAEAGRGDSLRSWVAQFNSSQDEVEIEPVAIPFATLANTVFTQMGAGGGPDLIRFDQTDFFAAIPAKRIRPLDGILDDASTNFLSPDKYMKVDGVRYGFLFDTTGYGLLYNTDFISEPPADFESFLRVAKEQTVDGRFGYAYRATMAQKSGFWQDVCNFVFGFGGRWTDDEGKLTLNSPEVIKGIEAYKAAYDADIIPKGVDSGTFLRMFWERKIAMNINNGGVGEIFYKNAPDLPFAVAPSPFPDPAQGLIMTALVINANSSQAKADAAAKFIAWAYKPENQNSLVEAMGTNVGTKVELTEEQLKARPWLPGFDKQMQNALPQLVIGYEDKTMEISQIILEQVLEVLQSGADPKAAMDKAQALVERRVLR